MSDICAKEACTACKLCQDVCPKKCIEFQEDELGCIYPNIRYDSCIECGLCRNACPSLHPVDRNKRSDFVYVACAVDEKIRETSASGGIAAALYRLADREKWAASGCYLNDDLEAVQTITVDRSMYDKFQNSKYVYSDISACFAAIKSRLDEGTAVLFIGVPCQVAAVKRRFEKHEWHPLLYTVDLICHGFAPASYLKAHIKSIIGGARRRDSTVSRVFFRDPKYKTNNFVFSLYDRNQCFYHKKVKDNDVYQIGYHKALIYRENCYRCQYAQDSRIGDLTISDFSGLGRKAPIEAFFQTENVSCVIVNNEKGRYMFDRLLEENMIKAAKRPSAEAYDYEKQLRHPSIAHRSRNEFKEKYKQRKDFEAVCKSILRKERIRNVSVNLFHLTEMKSFLSGLLPAKCKSFVKKRVWARIRNAENQDQ